jgi:phospholipid/cholesterol/gamma-HCH transport system substrate-binding protein
LTPGRIAAIAALIAACLLTGFAMFGDQGYTLTATFANGGQLVKGDQVDIGGRPVGSVKSIELTANAQADVKLKLDNGVGPLHEGTVATIRTPSLSGIANRYVSLTPGPNSRPKLDDGARIVADRTNAPVDLDQVFDTLGPRTRKALQQVIHGSADQYAGRSRESAASLKYLSPALFGTSQLTSEVALDEKVFERFLGDTATTVNAIASRRDDLAALVGNANSTFQAIGDQNVALDRSLQLLPSTLRKANTTFVNLRSTLDDLDVLVNESKPATKQLAAYLRDLRPLVRDARPTIRDLRTLISKPGKNNDLIELTAKQPRLAELTATVFPRTIRTLNRAQPVIEYARMYAPDLAAYLTKFGQGASNYDANGHFARIQPLFGGYSFADNPAGGVLTPVDPASKLAGFDSGNLQRCPGGATQPSPDGSSNWPVPDCKPSSAPSGTP